MPLKEQKEEQIYKIAHAGKTSLTTLASIVDLYGNSARIDKLAVHKGLVYDPCEWALFANFEFCRIMEKDLEYEMKNKSKL